MNSIVIDHCLNYYQEGHSENLFHDLSDMEEFHRHFQEKVASGHLRFIHIQSTDNLFIVCIADALQRFFDSIVFFTMPEPTSVTALIVLTKNRIIDNDKFVYSVGYHVRKELRGQRIASGMVKQAKVHARIFFDKFGPHYDLGPDDTYRYILESVVTVDNEASNRLASKLLCSEELVATGDEHRTKKRSNVYRLFMEH